MRSEQRSSGDPEKVVCTGCGAPGHKVVAMDAAASPMCGICRALELGGKADRLDMALEQVEGLAYRLVFDGDIDGDDARAAFAEAAARAAQDRQKAGLRPCPTFAETEVQIKALREWDRLDWNEVELS